MCPTEAEQAMHVLSTRMALKSGLNEKELNQTKEGTEGTVPAMIARCATITNEAFAAVEGLASFAIP